jgi:hypothetical protein
VHNYIIGFPTALLFTILTKRCYILSESNIFHRYSSSGHGFKSRKQSLAEMQEKTVDTTQSGQNLELLSVCFKYYPAFKHESDSFWNGS